MTDRDKKTVKIFSLIGFIFVSVLGTFLHFAFGLSGGNTLIGSFAPVNESVWEHLKLLLFPMILFSAAEYFVYGKNIKNFFPAKIWSAALGMMATVIVFYTYTGIIGRSIVPVDIAIFYLSVAFSYYVAYRLMMKPGLLASDNAAIGALAFLTAVIILFIYFTYNPPMLEIFRDPLTSDFGIIG